MATFNYTKAQWDKERAKALPSTGLGKALVEYEAAIKRLFALDFLSGQPAQIRAELPKARAALARVEEVRRAAIKTCGKLYPETKKLLESADPDRQEALIVDALVTQLRPALEEWRKKLEPRLLSAANRVKVATKDRVDLAAIRFPAGPEGMNLLGEMIKSYMKPEDQVGYNAKSLLGEVGFFVISNTAFRATVKPLEPELVALGKRAALLEKLGTDLAGLVAELRTEIPAKRKELGLG